MNTGSELHFISFLLFKPCPTPNPTLTGFLCVALDILEFNQYYLYSSIGEGILTAARVKDSFITKKSSLVFLLFLMLLLFCLWYRD